MDASYKCCKYESGGMTFCLRLHKAANSFATSAGCYKTGLKAIIWPSFCTQLTVCVAWMWWLNLL